MAPFSDEYLFVEIANKVCIYCCCLHCIAVCLDEASLFECTENVEISFYITVYACTTGKT